MAVLHQILPPISPASHYFHEWHLSGSRPGLGSSVPPMFLQGASSTSLYPRLNMQIYRVDGKRNLKKPGRAAAPRPSAVVPALGRKLCFTQSARERKTGVPQESSRGGFLPHLGADLSCRPPKTARLSLWACTQISWTGQAIWLRVAVTVNFLHFPKEYFPTAFVFPFSPRPAHSDVCF